MATFADLQQRVMARLQDVSGTAVAPAIVKESINLSIKARKNTKYWFNETSQTVTLTIGNPVIPISGFVSLYKRYGMRMAYNSGYIDLPQLDPAVYDSNNYGQIGVPQGYIWRAGQYLAYYFPQQAYVIIATGLEDYPDLVADGESNDFTINADAMIVYDAASRAIYDIRQDDTMSQGFAARADAEEQALFQRTNQVSSTGYNYAPPINDAYTDPLYY